MNVVSIMAHQDDEMRCLGTMLKCRARGDRLFFVAVTDGSSGLLQQPNIPREEAARIQDEEMSRLCGGIGATYTNLGELDEFLYDTPDVRRRLIGTIRRTQADLIFTHHHEDYNLDHTTVNALVRQSAMNASLPVVATDSSPLEAHPAIFTVSPHGPFEFPMTHFVDISDYEEEKVALLQNHCSQEEAMRSAVGRGLETLCRTADAYWGSLAGCAYAECFTPMRARGAIKPFNVLP